MSENGESDTKSGLSIDAIKESAESASELSTQANQLSQALDRFVTDGNANVKQSQD